MKGEAVRAALILGIALLVTPVLGAAEGGAKPPDPNAPRDPNAAAQRVYTNKDLARYRAEVPPARVIVDTTALGKKDEGAPAPSEVLYPEEKERRMAEIEKAIEDAEAELARVEVRSTAVVNPLKERRIAAPTEEEIKAESGLGRSQVYANLQAQKADLEKKIADLRSDLATLIATPTKPRGVAAPTNPNAPPPQP